MPQDTFDRQMLSAGFSLFESLVPESLLARIRLDIPAHLERSRFRQQKNGLAAGMDGAAHHVVGRNDSLDEFLAGMYLDDQVRAWFGGPYILNSYGAVNNLPRAQGAYLHGLKFHRDVRTYSGDFRLMLNMLVMIDDFTVDNGATQLVPGSHRAQERPGEDELAARAVRLTGRAGSIALFDSNVWHCAAPNLTELPRRALTLTFTRPFFKQQMDYPRLLGEGFTQDEKLRQVLGYHSRVPSSHDQWYQPPEKRMYRPGQG